MKNLVKKFLPFVLIFMMIISMVNMDALADDQTTGTNSSSDQTSETNNVQGTGDNTSTDDSGTVKQEHIYTVKVTAVFKDASVKKAGVMSLQYLPEGSDEWVSATKDISEDYIYNFSASDQVTKEFSALPDQIGEAGVSAYRVLITKLDDKDIDEAGNDADKSLAVTYDTAVKDEITTTSEQAVNITDTQITTNISVESLNKTNTTSNTSEKVSTPITKKSALRLGTLLGGALSTTTVYTPKNYADQTLEKNWNDNNSTARSSDEYKVSYLANNVHLQYSLDNGATWTTLSTDTIANLGLTAMPILKSSDTTTELNYWKYVYNLPTQLSKEVTDINGTTTSVLNITWKFNETTPDGYVASSSASEPLKVMNTKIADDTFNKVWLDNSNAYSTRPSATDWLKDIHLMQYVEGSDIASAVEVTDQVSATDVSGTSSDMWKLDLSKSQLPAYDANGIPYLYYLQESNSATISIAPTVGEYSGKEYVNSGNFAPTTDKIYAEGTLTNTLAKTTQFTSTKIWADGNRNWTERPKVTFELYRYPQDSGSYETASPVQGFDNYTLSDTSGVKVNATASDDNNTITFTYTGSDGQSIDLPAYDNAGHRYVYFAREKLSGNNSDYQTTYTDKNGDKSTYLLNGGKVENKLSAQETIKATKTFKALAIQNMDADNTSVTFKLQQSKDNTTWSDVTDSEGAVVKVTESGFRTESQSRVVDFGTMPKYDSLGNKLYYKVVETGIKLNGVTATTNEDGSFTVAGKGVDGTDANFSVAYDNDTNTVTNTLTGKVDMVVKKNWNPLPPAGTSITYQLTGSDGSSITKTITPTEISANSFDYTFNDLPRYDANGAEITYTVSESTNASGYRMSYNYGKDSNHNYTCTFNNAKGDDNNYIEVSKNWLDDSDLISRENVVVSAFKKSDDTLIGSVTLSNATNYWHGYINIGTNDPADCYVTETKMGNNEVTYGADKTSGTVKSTDYQYKMSVTKNSNSNYTITNLRYGTLKLTMTKTWKTGKVTPKATFTVTRLIKGVKDTEWSDTFTLSAGSDNTATWTSDNYEKFDAKGQLYDYAISETGLEGYASMTEAAAADYTNSTKNTGVTYGSNNHTGDVYQWVSTNGKSNTTNIIINKVWRDAGSNEVVRPDVFFTLYRSTLSKSEIKELTASKTNVEIAKLSGIEKVIGEREWNTKHNNWYWSCNVGDYAKYDSNGNDYNYFAVETMYSAKDYKTKYYNGTTVPNDGEQTNTKNVFDPDDYATLSSDSILFVGNGASGSVVNYREDTRSINGKKIWQNLPSGFKTVTLPDIVIKLSRYILDENGNKVMDTGFAPTVTIANGETSYTFGNNLSKYDDYGRLYYYTVSEETQINGYASSLVGDYVVTNVYMKNPTTDKAEIIVKKQWSGITTNTAATSFELWRKAVDGNGVTILNSDTKINTYTFASGTPADMTYTFTKDSSGNNLPYYSPTGSPYIYYLKEAVPYGYEANTLADATTVQGDGTNYKVGGDITLSETDTTNHVWTNTATADAQKDTTFVNTYNGQQGSLSGTKLWQNLTNYSGTLINKSATQGSTISAFDVAQCLSIKLERKASYDSEWKTIAADDYDIAWIVNANTSNGNTVTSQTWKYTITNKAGKDPVVLFDTTSTKYQYRVTETCNLPGFETVTTTATSTSDATKSTVTMGKLENRMKVKKVTYSKKWAVNNDGTTSDMTSAQSSTLTSQKIMPSSVNFKLQYSDDNGTNWSDYTGFTSLSSTYANLFNNKTITISSYMPYYAPDTTTERIYRTIETSMVIDGKTVSLDADGHAGNFDMTYTNSNAGTATAATAITNTIALRSVTVRKVWNDNSNRNNTRPSNLVIYLKRDASAYHTFTLTSANQATADETINGKSVKSYNIWEAKLIVPVYKDTTTADYSVYSANEQTTVTNYSADTEYDEAKQTDSVAWTAAAGNNDFAFGNTYDNVNIPLTTTIAAKKTWSDNTSYKAQTRPESLTYTLQVAPYDSTNATYGAWVDATSANCGLGVTDTAQKTITLASDGSASASWVGVYQYSDAHVNSTPVPMHYRVVETQVNGYTTTYSSSFVAGSSANTDTPINLTNTLDTVSAKITKRWGTNSNTLLAADRPDSITFRLLKSLDNTNWSDVKDDANNVVTTDATSASNWSATINNLPKTDLATGSTISYRFVEYSLTYGTTTTLVENGSVLGYSVSEGETTYDATNKLFTTTITNEPTLTSATGTKTWDDENNRDGLRTAVTLQLYRDDVAYGTAVSISASDNWQHKWENLPQYKKGTTTASVYSVKEVNTPSGYIKTESGMNVTNTENQSGKVLENDFTATKVWSDASNKFNTRQDVTMTLKYSLDNGKTWLDPTKVTAVQLPTTDGALVYTTSDLTQTLSAQAATLPAAFTWSRLPEYALNASGVSTRIMYKAVETAINGYTQTATTPATNVYNATITNTLQTASASINKTWGTNETTNPLLVDEHPDSITFRVLQSKGNDAYVQLKDADGNYVEVTTDAAKNWTASVSGLPKVAPDGSDYKYQLSEYSMKFGTKTVLLANSPYTASSSTTQSGTTFTSATQNTLETVTKTATKIWNDENDRDGLRTVVTLQLYRDGSAYEDAVSVNVATNWQHTWNNLPKYQKGTKTESVYTVREVNTPSGYTKNEIGMNVTNTHAVNSLTKSAMKIWSGDSDNKFNTRGSVTLTLKYSLDGNTWQDVTHVDSLSVSDNTSVYTTSAVTQTKDAFAAMSVGAFTWNDLPQYANDANGIQQSVQYKVVEANPTIGYVVTYNADGTDVTNTLQTVSTTINKTWGANEIANPLLADEHPDCITFRVLQAKSDNVYTDLKDADGNYVEVTIGADENWTASVSNLPKVAPDGSEYKYQLSEYSMIFGTKTVLLANSPYTAQSSTDAAFTTATQNTLATVTKTATKIWNDENDRDGLRTAVTLQLYRDGSAYEDAVSVNAEAGWQHTWNNLPKYQKGTNTESVYTAREVNTPSGYTKSENGLQVTNTHNVNSVAKSAYKVWSGDSDNKFKTRGSVTLTLKYSLDGKTWQNVTHVDETVSDNTSVYTTSEVTQTKSAGDATAKNAFSWQNMPKYVDNAEGQREEVKYQVFEEKAVNNYIVTYSNDGNDTLITNTLNTGDLSLLKTRVGGVNETFKFKIKLFDENKQETYYTGEYQVINTDNATSDDKEGTFITTSEGYLEIKSGQKFKVSGLPAGWTYEIEEINTGNYNITASNDLDGTIAKDEEIKASLTNSMINELAIDNTTINPSDKYVDQKRSDAGGSVTINNSTSSYDMVDYEPLQITTTWKPAKDWNNVNTFTVTYEKMYLLEEGASSLQNGSISVKYLDDDGKLLPATDSAYDELRKLYPDFKIEMDAENKVTLILANDANGMLRKQEVLVSFTPTIAVENTTVANAGGSVQVKTGVVSPISDGDPSKDGHPRYSDTEVIGAAKTGYMVDMSNLTIGLPGTSEDAVGSNPYALKIKPATDGTFTATIKVTIAGVVQDVTIYGKVIVVKKDEYGNPTKILVLLNKLPISIDIGIPFVKAKVPSANVTPGTDTGDTTQANLWMLLMLTSLSIISTGLFKIKKFKKQQ